jgi:hypothetical protein
MLDDSWGRDTPSVQISKSPFVTEQRAMPSRDMGSCYDLQLAASLSPAVAVPVEASGGGRLTPIRSLPDKAINHPSTTPGEAVPLTCDRIQTCAALILIIMERTPEIPFSVLLLMLAHQEGTQ